MRERIYSARRSARRRLIQAAVAAGVGVAASAIPAGLVSVGSAHASESVENEFVQTNLISDRSDQGALVQDANLQNPWGLALGPTSPLWVADNNAGVATIYHVGVGGTTASKVDLTVNVPGGRTATGDGPSPTGQVFNPTTGFSVTSASGTGPAFFIFDSEAGQISAWSPVADPPASGMATAQLEFTSPSAVYKGLAIATGDSGTFLYAANFHDGTVDVFNSQWQPVATAGGFSDPSLPAGYAPFGIQDVHNLIYVTYALQNSLRHDDVAGAGHGFIDVYTPDGFLVKRLASRDSLNSPWGMAIAPDGFGPFSGQLLVGNFGDGKINVFDPFSGKFLGRLENSTRHPIQIDDLWGLKVGTASTGGTHTLLFSAGINDEKDGLVGSINPAP
jgi:uncharacterized protein (TIGR03118 family)